MQEVPGNTLDKARLVNVNSNTQVFTDKVNSLVGSDFWRVSLSGRSSLNIRLDALTADADIELIRDANANLKVDEGEVIAHSRLGGTNAEFISNVLNAGDYYIRVYPYGNVETTYNLSVSGDAGNSLDIARSIAVDSSSRTYRDWVGSTDKNDYYAFNINTNSSFKAQLNGLSADADIELVNSLGQILTHSRRGGILEDSINYNLQQGTYYIRVLQYSGDTDYNLIVSATPLDDSLKPQSASTLTSVAGSTAPQSAVTTPVVPQNSGVNYLRGTLRADTFTYQLGSNITVVSGNGNIDFGSGARDTLDLSSFASNSVSFNQANTGTGGVVYNPGNGSHVFDAIKLNNGNEILFEGIERIRFSDTTIDLSVVPNDPLFNQQWNLHVMGVQNAWRFTQGSSGVLIGVQDTGLVTNTDNGSSHPDLRAISSFGGNIYDESPTFSHGTLVTGVIAATTNNGQGMSGINSGSTVLHIDIVGGTATDLSLASATQAMIDQANSAGQRLVVNMSVSGGWTTTFEQLVANNQDKALFVIASGNGDQSTIASPANLAARYGNVIAVGSSWGTKDAYGNNRNPGERITYKNWWGSNYGEGLTLMAPSEFTTTNANKNSSGQFEFGYNSEFNGTSASAPNVTGVASLVWSINPNLTATAIKQILAETAYDLGASGYDTVYGHGLTNADAAVRRAIAITRGAT